MKFNTDTRPPRYLNRRDQYRLLAMVGVLCLVMVAVNWSARPSSWHWLVPPDSRPSVQAPSLKEIDFRVQSQQREPLGPDMFRAVAVTEKDEPQAFVADSADVPADVPADIAAEVLAPIVDNTLGLRRKEADAYHLMLSRIHDLPEETAAALARDDVAFTVLMLHPDEYRGTLLAVRGELRRLTEFPASRGSGFDVLYEGWLFTGDSGTNPYRIVFTELPGGVPLGESLHPPLPVQVVGYFFKRYGYVSQGGQHVAPLLLARSLRMILRPATAPADGAEFRYAMLGVIAVVVAGVVVLGVWFFVSDRRFRGSRLDELAAARLDATPEDLAALQNLQTTDPARPFEQPDADT